MNFKDFFEKMTEGPMVRSYAVFKIFLDHPNRKFTKKEIHNLLSKVNGYYFELWTKGNEPRIPPMNGHNVPTVLNDRLKKLLEEGFIESNKSSDPIHYNSNVYFLAPSFRMNWKLKPKEVNDISNISELMTWHEMFKKYEGLPIARELQRAFNHELDRFEKNDRKSAHLIVDFETPYVNDSTKYYIQQCYSCVEECLIIEKITYLSYYQAVKEPDVIELKNFHPYLLKISKGQWYLIGKCAKDADFSYIPLNRIKELVPTENEFVRENFNPADLWKHSIGITRSKHLNLKVCFKVKNGPLYNNIDYLINNPILPKADRAAKPVIKDGWMEVEIDKIHIGPELVRVIRSIGRENIKDLKPLWLNEDLWEFNNRQEIRFTIELPTENHVKDFAKLSKKMLRISEKNDNEFAEFIIGEKVKGHSKWREITIRNIAINAVFANYAWYLVDSYKSKVSKDLSKLIQ